MDPFPPNVERLAAAPFSLDAARLRRAPEAPTAPLPPPHSAERAGRRHPRLELVAGSAVPGPTPAQVTDARDRFLHRLTTDRGVAPSSPPVPIETGHPNLALLHRVPWLVPTHDDGPRGA